MFRVISIISRGRRLKMSSLSCYLQNPDDNFERLFLPVYAIKKGIAIASSFCSAATDWATLGQQINDYVLPIIAKIGNVFDEFSLVAKEFSRTFQVIGLGEHFGDMNYFMNGDAYKDLTHWRIPSFISHIISVPAHWISTTVFLKAVNLAQTIGEVRVFAWAAQAGTALQKLPVLGSIPKLAEAGLWLSEVQIFRWVPLLATLGAVAEGLLCGVTGFLFADALQRFFYSQKKINVAEQNYRNLLEKHKITDLTLKSLLVENKLSDVAHLTFRQLGQGITPLNQVDLGRLKIKLVHQHNKNFQAKVDMVATVAQFALQVALILGLTCLGAIFVLGTAALITGGISLYYKATLKKPDLDAVLQSTI